MRMNSGVSGYHVLLMLEDLEERLRRLEQRMRDAEDQTWPDATTLPEPLPWPERARDSDRSSEDVGIWGARFGGMHESG